MEGLRGEGSEQRKSVLAWMVCVSLLSSSATLGQEQRVRSLVYDPERSNWVETAPPAPGTAEGELHAIRVQLKKERYRRALTAIKAFVKRHGRDHSLFPEVLIAKAKALIGQRNYLKAHVVLQEFLGEFAGIRATSEALRLEFVIAEAFLSGVKRKFWGVRLLSGGETALRILDELSTDYPQSRLAELALKTKGDYLFAKGEHALAELEYGRLMREYPQGGYHQFALRRSADAALASFNGVEYDEAALIEAEERFHEYRGSYPTEAEQEDVELVLNDIRGKRAEKDFTIGDYYERTGHLSSAIFQYQWVRKDWPDTIAAIKAATRLELLGVLKTAASDRAGRPLQQPAGKRDPSNR